MAEVPSEIADELYAIAPQQFVAARDKAFAAAQAAGDSKRAAAVAGLRKPTVAAWLVNLLAIKRPDLIDELMELSASLRAAQRELRGEQLRELSAQRRAVVAALVAQARSLAVAAQPGLAASKLPLAEVEATLTAALADADVAELVRSGRMVKTTSYAGFGETPKSALKSDAPQPTDATEPAEPRRRRTVPEHLQQELADARAAVEAAREQVDQADTALLETTSQLAAIEAELAELQRRRAAVQEELNQRRHAQKVAQRTLAAADRRVGEAEVAIEDFLEES
jgi:hypothetical protein